MKFDDTVPVVIGETRKQAPAPEAARNLSALLFLAVGIGVIVGLACRLLGLSSDWSVMLGMVAAVVLVMVRFDDLTLTVEESTAYSDALPVVQQAVNWEIPVGPHQIERGTLIASPALVIEWARAVAGQQSLSYATWGERFGGERKYAVFRKRLVDSGLAVEQGKELVMTRKGWALFTQIAERGSGATPLLENLPIFQASRDSERL